MVEAGICHFGDTTSNQAEQMNWSIEQLRHMGPTSMVVHATTKFLEKKARRVIEGHKLMVDGQEILPIIQERAAKVKLNSTGWICTIAEVSFTNGLHLE